MLIREASPTLKPGAYLIGVAPAASLLPYDQLRVTLAQALKDFQR
jgi:hypothetical protein